MSLWFGAKISIRRRHSACERRISIGDIVGATNDLEQRRLTARVVVSYACGVEKRSRTTEMTTTSSIGDAIERLRHHTASSDKNRRLERCHRSVQERFDIIFGIRLQA